MTQKGFTLFDEIKFWFDNNNGQILLFFVIVSIFLYGYFTTSYKHIDFQEYTNEVELVNFDFEKSYALPDFYSTKQKLNKIIVDLIYFHNGIKYESKAILYRKYITPQLESIIEKKEIDRLMVKCKNGFPQEVMIFVKS